MKICFLILFFPWIITADKTQLKRGTFNSNQLECINTGNYPAHSRAPCDIGLNRKAGLNKVMVTNCEKSFDGSHECDWRDDDWKEEHQKRVNINAKVVCDYDKTEDIVPGSCNFVYNAEFKRGQEDMHPITIFIIILLVLFLFIMTNCGNDSYNGGFWGGYIGASLGSNCDDIGGGGTCHVE